MGVFGRLLGRRKPRWEPDWATFTGSVDDRPSTWRVDLAAVAAAPVDGLPVRLDVTAPYEAGDDGQPTPAELTRLDQLHDALARAVAALGGAVIGQVSTAGSCRFTAHLPDEAKPSLAQPAGGGDAPTSATEFDPHWAYVRDALAPDERQAHTLDDLGVVNALRGSGDSLDAPRDIQLTGYFELLEQADAAATELVAAGYHADVERDDEGGYALTATRHASVAPPALHELTWAVREMVEHNNGVYDGWSCPVTTG
jgi:hypothetical protein